MLEILILLVVMGGFQETAKRRGVKGWPFIVAGVLGYLVFGIVAAGTLGRGPHLFVAWGWIGLVYVAIFLIGGGGRRHRESWQCSECSMFNSPATLVCPCGYEPPADAEASKAEAGG